MLDDLWRVDVEGNFGCTCLWLELSLAWLVVLPIPELAVTVVTDIGVCRGISVTDVGSDGILLVCVSCVSIAGLLFS